MPARNSHSCGAVSGGKAITFFHTVDTGASIVTLVVTETRGGSSLAACSANITNGSTTSQAANVGGVEGRLRQPKTYRATSPPAIEKGRASGRAIRRQISPSYLKPIRESPIRRVVIVLTAIVLKRD